MSSNISALKAKLDDLHGIIAPYKEIIDPEDLLYIGMISVSKGLDS